MPIDLTPQQSKALDFKHSISLKANAGSGKTYVLAKRYLNIALEGKVPLQKIAAITFTDKAAGELYKRISEEVDNLLDKADDNLIRQDLEKIRRQLVSANISTIHSFCINILREFPVEAELDANFVPIDQNIASELLELSIEESLKVKLEEKSNREIRSLIRLFGSKNYLVKQLHTLIDHRKVVLSLKEKIYKNNANDIAEYFSGAFEKYFSLIYVPLKNELVNNLVTLNDIVLNRNSENKLALSVAGYIGILQKSETPLKIIEIIKLITDTICTKNNTIRKRDYLNGKLAESFNKQVSNIEKIIDEFHKIQLVKDSRKIELQLATTGKYLINIFDEVLSLYDCKKKELGYLDYEGILIKTRSLLESDNVIKYLSDKFSYLMVDEYQDTNEIQYEIFMPILEYLKKGNLFIVGDEKQSIYRFRDAELEIFERTSTDIAEKHGNDFIITLPDSFRMEPAICLFTNRIFRNLFQKPNQLYNEVKYSELICAKPLGEGGAVKILIADEDSDTTEAQLISKQIIEFLHTNSSIFDWKDIAVLVRRRSSFKYLEKEFTRFNIPYRIVGGRGFFQRQSIYDIYNYFSFLLNTSNDAALVGILRSPFFLFDDAEIYEMSLKYGKSFWEKMLNSISRNEKISKAVHQLNKNIEMTSENDISAILRNLLENTNFIAVLASRPDGDQELANIEKLKRITNHFTNQGFRTLYDYVNYLKDAISKLEDEAQAGLVNQSNAVSILTLHQSKGLEFPVVFLYKCNEVLPDSSIKSKSIAVDKNLGLLTKVALEENYFEECKSAPIVAIRNYMEHRKNFAEAKRLFYVGITRAKSCLFITATQRGENAFNTNSFIGMLYDSMNIDNETSEFNIEDDLTFLTKENGKYIYVKKTLALKIPIVKKIALKEIAKEETSTVITSPQYLLDKINDISKGEIISATKVSMYSQCPLKYCLIYKYGYSELFSEFKEYGKFINTDYSYLNTKEKLIDEGESQTFISSRLSGIKGQIVHKALEREIDFEKLDSFIEEEINLSYLKLFVDTDSKMKFKENVKDLLNKFYNSEQFKYLKDQTNYKNEFEIYLGKNNYFLFGIIDKIIIDEKRYILIDYKTDDIDLISINERAKYYLTQLNFYVYIISNLYKEFDDIEIRILFLKFPNNPFMMVYNKEAVKRIGEDISNIISKILANDFQKNLSHCSECNFSVKNKCVV